MASSIAPPVAAQDQFKIETTPVVGKLTGLAIKGRDALEGVKCSEGVLFLSSVRSVIVRTVAATCFLVLSLLSIVEAVVRGVLAWLATGLGFIPLGDTFQATCNRFADLSFEASSGSMALCLANLKVIYYNFTEVRIQDPIEDSAQYVQQPIDA